LSAASASAPACVLARISAASLDLSQHINAVDDPACGAVTTFIGRVRDHDPDAAASVVALEYTAHPDAETVLAAIAERAAAGTVARVAVSHRIGRLAVGEDAVIIAVSAPHRAAAFDVCREVIEQIKLELPVWKKQLTSDGESLWKGLGG
jgi:molybdopterin synthase catalytic subunit